MGIEDSNIENYKDECQNKKVLMNKGQFFLVLLVLFLIIISFFLGINSNKVDVLSDLNVYIGDEEYTFRTEIGNKVYPILKDGQLYIPFVKSASFLDYMTIKRDNSCYLYTIEKGVNNKILEGFLTGTFDGEDVDSSIFKDAGYTALLLWGTWCSSCKEEMDDFKGLSDYLDKNNIQIVSIPIDAPILRLKDDLTSEFRETVNEITDGVSIKYHLFKDDKINAAFMRNSISIPQIVIFDEDGNMIKKIDKKITSKEFMSLFDVILRG